MVISAVEEDNIALSNGYPCCSCLEDNRKKQ